jgi:hypothetical protein
MNQQEREILEEIVARALDAKAPVLSDEEQMWVRMAIKKEAQSIALRQAVIEKTITALIWSGILGFGVVLLEFFRNHGFK